MPKNYNDLNVTIPFIKYIEFVIDKEFLQMLLEKDKIVTPINIMAKELPQYKPKVTKSKKKYNRKRIKDDKVKDDNTRGS